MDIIEKAEAAVAAAFLYRDAAHTKLAAQTPDVAALQDNQHAAHGYAWLETTIFALDAVAHWAKRRAQNQQAAVPALVAVLFGEYLAQIIGGIPMSQTEFVRPADLQLEVEAQKLADDGAVAWFLQNGRNGENHALIVDALADNQFAAIFENALLDDIRMQYQRFTDEKIIPYAHQWHLDNALIPDDLIADLSALGTFGVCIPENFGGLGLDGLGVGKVAMCVITEELSRGWIGAGSLGTRSEIAGDLILQNGSPAQKSHWLPKIASGEVLPTAVFTEPDIGSDLGHLKSRAEKTATGWKITGAKNWITHAARSDLMTLLARSDKDQRDHKGLSMFLVEKPRGSEADPFPMKGMSGSEIGVLGYRGMREYALAFDGVEIGQDALLGNEAGQGFRQLMRTFESARIQTAARAVGVARRALELALDYATNRTQFGAPIISFPRVSGKLVLMMAEIVAARELTYFAAGEKDKGRRCDIEAGMAKLLAARVAWSAADNALQIHGGNGYALEYEISRILCDARILNIFEGAGEIQAQVITRGRLSERN